MTFYNHVGFTDVAARQAAGGIFKKNLARFAVERVDGA
jgi:hypothetical protein